MLRTGSHLGQAHGLEKSVTALLGLASLHLVDQPLLGPPHMHQRPPQFCQYLGDTSPQSDPRRCSQAVDYLCHCYRHKLHKAARSKAGHLPPLVVNTHGWIQVVLLYHCWASRCG